MYVDPYEKFIHKPVKRVVPPSPIVPVERVKRPEPAVEPEPALEPAPKRTKRRRLSEQDIAKMVDLYGANPNRPLSSIARLIGCCHTTVYTILNEMGIYRKRLPDDLVVRMVRLRRTPGHVSINNRKKGEARQRREKIRLGEEAHHAAKLSIEDVRAMRLLYAQGNTTKDIAQMFSVTHDTARRAIVGKSWKNV